MSLSNEIKAVIDRMDVTTARDCVLSLRTKYADHLTFIAEQDHPAVHQEVTTLRASVAAHNDGSGTQRADGEFDVHLTRGWWELIGRVATHPSEVGRVDPLSPVVLHNRSEMSIIYGPAVAALGRQVLGNGLLYEALTPHKRKLGWR